MSHTAIRVDMECNADEFWTSLRDARPDVAKSLERNGCAVVGAEALAALTSLGAFAGEPSPLIDCGTAGDQYGDVVSGRHEVIE